MKLAPYYIILLFITSSCVSNTHDAIVNVISWEQKETKVLNNKIQKSHEAGLEWVQNPELYIFNLFNLANLKRVSYEYSVDSVENPINIEITLIRDGFLDDSVRGDIHHINLTKNKDGIWEVKSLKRAVSCWREKRFKYSAEPCP